MRYLNKTPHAVGLIEADGTIRILPPSYPAVRVATTPGPLVSVHDGVGVHAPSTYGRITNLPDRQEGVLVVVSQIAALAIAATMPDRTDVVYPATRPSEGAVRTSCGTTTAVARFIRAC